MSGSWRASAGRLAAACGRMLATVLLLAGCANAPSGPAPGVEDSVGAALGERRSEAAETAALAVLDTFMEAFNRRDLDAVEATFVFPHIRVASGTLTVLERAGTRPADFFDRFAAATGWDHSAWSRREVVHSSDTKVHVAVVFTRYRADGSIIGHYPSLYIVTRTRDGWGIHGRSSYAQ